MSSIDLIPTEFRQSVTRSRHIRWALISMLFVTALTLLAGMYLAALRKDVLTDMEHLRGRQALSQAFEQQLDSLDQRLKALNDEWALLQGLRSGAPAEEVFRLVDRSLPGSDVWFTRWSFQRAGVVAPNQRVERDTGYFIVIEEGREMSDTAGWQVETRMSISGQAKDHAALSRFVRGLYDQSEVVAVKLNQTRVRDYANVSVVDFELAVTLRSRPTA